VISRLSFVDGSGRAGDSLRVSIANAGKAAAEGVTIRFSSGTDGAAILLPENEPLGVLDPGAERRITVPVTAFDTLPGREAGLVVGITSSDGWEPETRSVRIPLRQMGAPRLVLSAGIVSLKGRQGALRRGDTAAVVIAVENVGAGPAVGLTLSVRLDLPGGSIICLSGEGEVSIPDLGPREAYRTSVAFVADRGGSGDSVGVYVAVSEARAPFSVTRALYHPLVDGLPDATIGAIGSLVPAAPAAGPSVRATYRRVKGNPFAGAPESAGLGVLRFADAEGGYSDLTRRLHKRLAADPAVRGKFIVYSYLALSEQRSAIGVESLDPGSPEVLRRLRDMEIRFVAYGVAEDEAGTTFRLKVVRTEDGATVLEEMYRPSAHSDAVDDAVRFFARGEKTVYAAKRGK
jgi:hypothetical protein